MTSLDNVLKQLEGLSPQALSEIYQQFQKNPPKFIPNPGPQTDAWNSKADILLYGGQAGGGKTALGLGLALTEHKRSLLMRRQGVDLSAMHEELIKFYGSRDGWNGSAHGALRTKDHKLIEFGAAKTPGDEQAWMGRAHDFLYIDEATHFQESQVRLLMGWVRTTDPNQRTRIILGTNPPITAEGDWIVGMFRPWLDPMHPSPAKAGELRWFVTNPDGEDLEVDGPDPVYFPGQKKPARPMSRSFIPAKLSDNPYLARTDYEAKLDGLPEPLRSAVRDGNFMAVRADSHNQVIPTDWVVAAQGRWKPEDGRGQAMTSMGFDPAGGGADAAVIARRHGGWYNEMIALKGLDTKDGAVMCAAVLKVRKDSAPIVLDVGGGYAGAIIERLKDNNIPFHRYNGNNSATSKALGSGMKFANKRAEAYWKFREALDPDQEGGSIIALPPDTELRSELTAVTWKPTTSGLIQLEVKDKVRELLGRSPNKADAVVMALTEGSHAASRNRHSFVPRVITKAPRGRR
jgi:hypothetical protein